MVQTRAINRHKNQRLEKIIAVACVAAALAGGCGQKPSPRKIGYAPAAQASRMPDLSLDHDFGTPPAPPPEPEDNSPPFQVEDPNMASVVNSAKYIADWKKTLRSMVQSFLSEQGRLPHNLDELVQYGQLDAIPAAPGGQRFELEPRYGQIILVGP